MPGIAAARVVPDDINNERNKFYTVPLIYLVGDLGVNWKPLDEQED